jgi:hypothetical protein
MAIAKVILRFGEMVIKMNQKMNWKILFSFLFVASVVMMFVSGKKSLLEVNITREGVVVDAQGKFVGNQPPEIVKREYRDNYIAVGMVIGFAIIAGASVIALAFTIRDNNSTS